MYFPPPAPKLIAIFLHHSPKAPLSMAQITLHTPLPLSTTPPSRPTASGFCRHPNPATSHSLHSHSLGHYSFLNQSFPRRQSIVCVRHCHFLLPRSWTNRLRTYYIICFSDKSALACTLCWVLTLQSPCLCLSSEHTRTILLCEPSFWPGTPSHMVCLPQL